MRHPHLDAALSGLKRDEAADFGLLDRCCIGDSCQGRKFDRLPNRQHVDHIADRRGHSPDTRFNQLDETGWHDQITNPTPVPVLLHNSAVGDFLLDDVLQIQNIASRQLP
jgi:hypothetical protein